MKIRSDFVTNSSSSSYIVCFARIVDEEKANKILKQYHIDALTADEVKREQDYSGCIGADWCGAYIYGSNSAIRNHPDSKFIVIQDWNEADYDEDCEPIYDYDFSKNDAINSITKENGFDDIEVAEGEGRNG